MRLAILVLSIMVAALALGFSPSPSEAVGPPPRLLQTGDVDCDYDVDSVDALKILRYVAGLSVQQNEPCPDIGNWHVMLETASGTDIEQELGGFGNNDCDNNVDSVDAQRILNYVAGFYPHCETSYAVGTIYHDVGYQPFVVYRNPPPYNDALWTNW